MGMTRSEAFRILECDSDASVEIIRANYKRLALRWHPDKHSNSPEATTKFQEISEAYKRLTSTVDDDNIKFTMSDMFDLFAHIFFTNGRYYATTGDVHYVHYSDDENHLMRSSDSSDDDDDTIHVAAFHAKGRNKYCDLARSPNSNKNNKTNIRNNVSEAEAMKNAEELIKEEERKKKKAEKRRAKKKRNRAKRKEREKGEKTADDDEDEDSDDENPDRSDEETREENRKHKKKSTNKKTTEDSDSERDEGSWDTSSAFFANAARRGPVNNPCTASEMNPSTSSAETSGTVPNINIQSNAQPTRVDKQRDDDDEEELEPIVIKSRQLAVQGNNLANEGKYKEAIEYFTKAVNLHNSDFRFFGNRSYCYDRLGEYSKALQDAEVTISLAPVWPKGYFRKGRALAGLKQYSDAEKAFSQVLKLDKNCDDAKFELTRVRVQQLKDMGFAHAQSERAVRLYGTVHAALDALLSGKVKNVGTNEEETYISEDEIDEDDEHEPRLRNEDMCSLWVGNIDSREVTERQLTQLFSKYGPIKFIRILPASFCAFVNYENKETAAKALQYLQGYSVGGQNLKLRYPNNDKYQKSFELGAKLSGPVNGDECYFWRTTGCAFGDKCRNAHIPSHRRVDLNKVEQRFGRVKPVKKGR